MTNALKGSHTVFLVTNYWETTNGDIEYAQGKNVTDVAKDVGVSYLIFSSLVHVTEETEGRLTHVPHFDSKANIEKYIRASGVPSTFVLPGYYMSNFTQMISKAADGSYQLFYPVDGKKSKFPLFDAAKDTGKTSLIAALFQLKPNNNNRTFRQGGPQTCGHVAGKASLGSYRLLQPRRNRRYFFPGYREEGVLRQGHSRAISCVVARGYC